MLFRCGGWRVEMGGISGVEVVTRGLVVADRIAIVRDCRPGHQQPGERGKTIELLIRAGKRKRKEK